MRRIANYKTAFFRDNKLYLIVRKGLLVMRAWPPSAWYRESPTAPWAHCRPELYDFKQTLPLKRLGQIRRQCDCFPERLLKLWRKDRDFFYGGYPEEAVESAPEHVASIITRIDLTRGQPENDLKELYRRSRMALPYFKRLDRRQAELDAFHAFHSGIPRDVITAIQPFPERHFSMASLCARCPGGLDLIESTPPLAMMLANCWVFGKRVKRPLRSARALLKKNQCRQLEWLGIPGSSKSVVRILRKIPTSSCTLNLLLYLRDALWDESARKQLAHLPRINRGVVLFASDPDLLERVTPSFLGEVAEMQQEDERASIGFQMREFFASLEEHGRVYGRRFESVHAFHQRYADELALETGSSLEDIAALRFPPPPILGSAHIVPIENPQDLIREGQAQRHCIAAYARYIAKGNGFAYRVQFPDARATLFLKPCPDGDGGWRVAECRARRNANVSMSVLERIHGWLEASSEDQRDQIVDDPGQQLFPGIE